MRTKRRFLVMVGPILAWVGSTVGSAAEPPAPIGLVRYAEDGFQASAFRALIDRPRVQLSPETRTLPDDEGLRVEHVSFAVEAGERATALIIQPPPVFGRRPAVIYLHGTGSNKERSLPRLKEFARRGFVAIGMDGRYHGERAPADRVATAYTDAIVAAYRTGKGMPFLYDTVWDVMRLVDYLQTRPEIDPSRIGLTGMSKGGMETYLAAAVETRITAAVSKHGVQSFRWGLEHGAWDSRAWSIRAAVEGAAGPGQGIDARFMRAFYDKVTPGIYAEFDGPRMVPLVAPRPFLIISGDSDPRTPQAGVREAVKAAETSYAAKGAPGAFEHLILPDTGHEETPAGNEATVEWFVRWLKP